MEQVKLSGVKIVLVLDTIVINSKLHTPPFLKFAETWRAKEEKCGKRKLEHDCC